MIGVPLAARPNDDNEIECESWVHHAICVHTVGKGHIREALCVLDSVEITVAGLRDYPELNGDPDVTKLALRMANDSGACVNYRQYTFGVRVCSRGNISPLSAVPFLGAYDISVEILQQASTDRRTRGPRPYRYRHF